MAELSNEELNQLLHRAYPSLEVSPDFRFRLWRRLMEQPEGEKRPLPARAAAVAAFAGILIGLLHWQLGFTAAAAVPPRFAVRSRERLDLFGNAPFDTLAGSYLRLTR